MSVRLHRQAELLMAEAELLVGRRQLPEARKCWLEAARFEAAAFEQIPRDRGQTRGIIAVSAVALFRDGGALDEALRLANEYLTTGNLPDAWKAELQALRDDVRAQVQTTTNGRAHKADQLDVSLQDASAGE